MLSHIEIIGKKENVSFYRIGANVAATIMFFANCDHKMNLDCRIYINPPICEIWIYNEMHSVGSFCTTKILQDLGSRPVRILGDREEMKKIFRNNFQDWRNN